MRGLWSCSSCILLLWSSILGPMAMAEPMPMPTPTAGIKRSARVEKMAKAQVTTFAVPYRRDAASMCPASYSLCSASLNGGCCQEGYACQTDSCYLTTPDTSTVAACGKAGYIQCPISLNGGCCPVGYQCGASDCTAPAGLTNIATSCPASYQLCAATYNYGCCPSAMACGPNACYSTLPVTYTVTSKVTTTSGGHATTAVQTIVTVETPTVPAGLPTDDPNYAAKFIPTSVPKVEASAAPESNTGLTTSEIGGIVGGAIALLLVVLTATFFIIRYLNRVVDAVESRKEASTAQTKSQAQAQMAYNQAKLHPSPSEVDAMSYDPLMMSQPSNGSTPQAVAVSARHRADSGSQASTAYNPSSATADLAAIRHTSMEFPGSYFDLPPRVQNVPGRHPGSVGGAAGQRISTDSQGTQFTTAYPGYAYQQHGRQYSNVSEAGSSDAGGGIGSPLIPAELDPTGVMGELPASHDSNGTRSRASSVASPRTSMQTRRRSDPPVSTAPGRNDALTEMGFAAGQQPLDVVNEGAEVIHGYYGPRDQAVGQTAAGLDIEHDMSSPVNMNRVPQWHDQPPQWHDQPPPPTDERR